MTPKPGSLRLRPTPVYRARQHTLDQAFAKHPERFVNRPHDTAPAKPKAYLDTIHHPTKPKRLMTLPVHPLSG